MSSDDTRTRILDAAGHAFASKGYEKATVREICCAARANLASVNYYFGDKQGLYSETVRDAYRRRCVQVPTPQWPQGTAAATKLRFFIHMQLSRALVEPGDSWETQLLMREVMHPTAACRTLVQDFFRPQFEMLQEILKEIVPSAVPTHRLHQLALSVVGQCIYYRIAKEVVPMIVGEAEYQEHYHVDQLCEHITAVCLAALGQAPTLNSEQGWQKQADNQVGPPSASLGRNNKSTDTTSTNGV